MPTFVAETEEKAQELGKGFVSRWWAKAAVSRPEHTLPPGYNSKGAIKMLAQHPGGSWLGVSPEKLRQAQYDEQPEEVDYNEVRRKLASSYVKAQKNFQILAGSPKTVIERAKMLLRILRPSIFMFFNVQGPVGNDDRLKCVRLLAEEVAPALRDYAKEIGLPDPYERTPGTVKVHAGASRLPVVDRDPLPSLGLQF